MTDGARPLSAGGEGGLPDVLGEEGERHAQRESEREWRLIVQSIPGLVALLTASGEVEVGNPPLMEYFGVPLEELRQWGTNGMIHPDDLPHLVDVFTSSIASGTPYVIEQRIRRSDGVYRWLENRGFPVRDSMGRITRWCVLLTDVHDRKHAQDALRDSERDSRLIVDSIPGLIAVFTPTGEVENVNRQALEYFGKSLEELREWGTGDATHPEDRPRIAKLFAHAMSTGTPFDWQSRARRSDGVYRWVQTRGYPLRNASGRIVRWYNLIIDIDERKHAEEALATSERNLKLTIDTVPALAWSASPDGATDFLNKHYLDYVGLSTEQASGWGWMTALHPEDFEAMAAAWQRIMLSEAPGEAEARMRRHDGEYRWFLFRASPLRDESGSIVKWYGVNTDIEDRKQAEEALHRARSELAHVARVTSIGALTASIAHEVNQPLAGIITNASTCVRMLDADPPNVDGARETAHRTIRDGHRAADVITRLRSLFSKRELALEPLDLNEAIGEVVALTLGDLQRNRVALRSELADDLLPVIGDRVQLQQVVVNLLLNASEAMSEVNDRPRDLLVRTEPEYGDRVRLTVRDVGMGVDPGSRDKLFEAFYTTKGGGMGIGLSVSRSIIDRHHGRLWVEPNDGPGATFALTLPCRAGEKPIPKYDGYSPAKPTSSWADISREDQSGQRA